MDLLDYALTMEEDLIVLYREQAKLHKENSLHTIFTLLENEEKKHAQILQSHADKIVLPEKDSKILEEATTLINSMEDFKLDIKDIPSQLEVYRIALGKEEESYNIYKELIDHSTNEQSKKVFGYLKDQEEKHRIILEELVKRVSRPEEWVESAEFGLREEY